MAKINDLKTWQEYCHTCRRFDRSEILWQERGLVPEYLRKLYELDKPLTASDLSYDLLKEMFLEIAAEATGGTFVIDTDNENAITLMLQYIRKDESFLKVNPSYSFSKGILLHGSVGSGKTLLMKIFHDLVLKLRFFNISHDTFYRPDPEIFSVITSNDIVQKFGIDGYLIFEKDDDRKTTYVDLLKKPLFIDDLGSEPEAIHYGQKTNILSEIIIRRYEKKSKTHITTNLAIDSIKKSYDLRVFDRLREMVNDVTLTGTSRRK